MEAPSELVPPIYLFLAKTKGFLFGKNGLKLPLRRLEAKSDEILKIGKNGYLVEAPSGVEASSEPAAPPWKKIMDPPLDHCLLLFFIMPLSQKNIKI